METNKVRWYLKDTGKEVCLGNNITYVQSIRIDKYPGLLFESEVTHPMDEEDAKILVEADILEAKEEKPVESYLDYLKEMASTEHLEYQNVLSSFEIILKLNPMAACSMLLKAISQKLNKKYSGFPHKVWIFSTVKKEPIIVDVIKTDYLNTIAWFYTKDDIDYAIKVCKPILNKC